MARVKYRNPDNDFKYSKWCYVMEDDGNSTTFCGGFAFIDELGEEDYTEEEQGRITCDECRDKIKEIKKVKL